MANIVKWFLLAFTIHFQTLESSTFVMVTNLPKKFMVPLLVKGGAKLKLGKFAEREIFSTGSTVQLFPQVTP